MTRLSDIPARYHAALAGERVDVQRGARSGPLTALDDEGVVIASGRGLHAVTRARFDEVTLPPTAHNTRALAVVLAAACGLDVSRGVTAGLLFAHVEHLSGVWVGIASGARRAFWHNDVPAIADIPITAPDALFRALVAALCALETA